MHLGHLGTLAHWMRATGIKKMDPLVKDTICVWSQIVSLSPFSLCPIPSSVVGVCSSPLFVEREGRQMVFPPKQSELGHSQSEDHDMHVRLAAQSALGPLLASPLSLLLCLFRTCLQRMLNLQ